MTEFRRSHLLASSESKLRAPHSRQVTPAHLAQVGHSAVMTTVSEDLAAGHFTARFKNSMVQAGTAHSSRFMIPPPGTFYIPLKSQEFVFSNTTVGMAEKLGDMAFNTDYDPRRTPDPVKTLADSDTRPTKRHCTRKGKKTVMTRLTIMRPVRNAAQVIHDAWRLILGQTSPEFLLEARTVCKDWNALLHEETIWRSARIAKYGEDSPQPPTGMTERRFADLLTGKGCQIGACPKTNTTKVFWAFRTRMCEDCFKERTVRTDVVAKIYGPKVDQHKLLELLPCGVIRSGKYKCTRQWHKESNTWVQFSQWLVYLCSDVEKILEECAAHIMDEETYEATPSWRAQKIKDSSRLMTQLAAIEEWERKVRQDAPDIRGTRKSFFETKAMELSPPILSEALHKIQAYHVAISSRRPPSEKCWVQLRSTILDFRAEAERLVDFQRQAESFERDNVPDIDRFSRLHAHRFARGRGQRELLPEQQYVVDLAREELSKCQNGIPSVADEDLVLLTLRNVFQRHYQTPAEERQRGLNADLQVGPLILTLDDARLIIDEVFEYHFSNDPRRRRIALEGFRCKGCPRQDCTRKYSFVDLFKHIYQKHAQLVGEGYYFDYFAHPFPPYGIESPSKFPWYTTEWPCNLPIAASHQEVNGGNGWAPDDVVEYVQLTKPSTISAFTDRVARKADLQYDDLLGNLARAAGKLKNTALGKELQTKVALEYALDLWQRSDHELQATSPSLKQFVDAMTELRRRVPSLSLRYRCGACVKARGVGKGSRFVKNPVGFHALLEHWNKEHADLNWRTDLMDLPDDREVLDQIRKADAELEQSKSDLRARELAKVNNPRKKSNAKAAVVLAMYSGMDVFDLLFDRKIREDDITA